MPITEESQSKGKEPQRGVFSSFVDDVLISLNSCDDNSTQHRYTSPPPPPPIRDEVDILLCDMDIPSTSTNSVKPFNRKVERTDTWRANEYSNHYSGWDPKRHQPNIQSQSPVYDDYAYRYRNATWYRTPTTKNLHSTARTIVNGFSPEALNLLQTDSCKKSGTFPPHFECKAYPLNTPGVCNKVILSSGVSKDDLSNGMYIIPPHRSGVLYNAEEFMNLFLDAQNRWARLVSVKEWYIRKIKRRNGKRVRRVNPSMGGWY
ncbi:9777_t:CDS:2 [Paraglomus brasilianum]|uniref:9777_t:CDS:1 n=1 Tax=Paraglomus brasilianum TaxID=144538 RepID=A0A9N8VL62_9GLOM|nr:9777_t:CDS:2 [Paraglomus brasilianum]